MDEIVSVLSAQFDGLVPASALRQNGVNAHAVSSMVNRRLLVPVRHGVYADAKIVAHAKPADRYRLLVRATALLAKRPVVLSHLSATAIHHLPIIGSWPKTTHVVEPDAGGGSSSAYLTIHRGCTVPVTVRIGEVTVTSLTRTLVDVALSCSFLVAVTAIDHALGVEQQRVRDERKRRIRGVPALTKDDLLLELADMNPHTGAKQAERAIDFGNGLSANPGETLSRVHMFQLGFVVPELQVHFGVNGRDYWVDYFWRGVRKIGEFDGLVKYTRGEVLGDRDLADVMIAEKRREDILRREVDSFCRWDWDTAYSPRLFRAFLMEHDVPRV